MGFESLIAPVVGGLLGGSDSGSSQSSQQQIDPRIAKYIYGDDSTTGIVPAAYDWYSQNKSGLNDQMAQGLNRQWAVYSDPANAQGYTDMQTLGSRLMGAPIAGNPFTDGRMTLPRQTPAATPTGLLGSAQEQPQVVQPQYQNPALSSAAPFTTQVQQAAPAQTSKSDLSWMNPKLKNLANALTGGGLLSGAQSPQPIQYANNN